MEELHKKMRSFCLKIWQSVSYFSLPALGPLYNLWNFCALWICSGSQLTLLFCHLSAYQSRDSGCLTHRCTNCNLLESFTILYCHASYLYSHPAAPLDNWIQVQLLYIYLRSLRSTLTFLHCSSCRRQAIVLVLRKYVAVSPCNCILHRLRHRYPKVCGRGLFGVSANAAWFLFTHNSPSSRRQLLYVRDKATLETNATVCHTYPHGPSQSGLLLEASHTFIPRQPIAVQQRTLLVIRSNLNIILHLWPKLILLALEY